MQNQFKFYLRFHRDTRVRKIGNLLCKIRPGQHWDDCRNPIELNAICQLKYSIRNAGCGLLGRLKNPKFPCGSLVPRTENGRFPRSHAAASISPGGTPRNGPHSAASPAALAALVARSCTIRKIRPHTPHLVCGSPTFAGIRKKRRALREKDARHLCGGPTLVSGAKGRNERGTTTFCDSFQLQSAKKTKLGRFATSVWDTAAPSGGLAWPNRETQPNARLSTETFKGGIPDLSL